MLSNCFANVRLIYNSLQRWNAGGSTGAEIKGKGKIMRIFIKKLLFCFGLMIFPFWEIYASNLVYNLNGGQLQNGDQSYSVQTTGTETILNNPTRSGYIFTGWEWCSQSEYTSNNNTCVNPVRVITENNSPYIRWVVPAETNEDRVYIAQWETDAFQVETTIFTANDSNNNYFAFRLSAAGTFYIDWGDGNVEYIERTDNLTNEIYSHTYTTNDAKTIHFGGVPMGYNSDDYMATLQFGSQAGTDWTGNSVNNNLLPVSSEYSRHKVKKLTGSATTLLKRISTVTSYTRLPSFYSVFAECDNLSSVSNELFNLYNGTIGIYYPRTAMFAYTFYNCVNLNLSNNGALFNHIHNGAPELFANTFRGCSKLKYVSSDTFYGITDGYRSMFDGTFADCSSLLWPYTNFRVTNPAKLMFHSTFENCTSIRAFGPVVFAPGLTGVAAEGMYEDMFKGCTNLSGSVPTSLFANITPSSSSGNINPALYSMSGIFQGTNLDTQCPSNAIINTTGFEAAWTITDDNACVSADAPSNCKFAVSCTPCANGLAADATHTECIEPTYELFIDTTNDTESFDFSICADGVFFVDWGDGAKDTYNVKYEQTGCVPASHTYSSSGSYTISLGGRATDYHYTSVDRQVVSFYGDTEIAEVRGSLGGIFPVIKDANDNVIATPWFENTFTDCTNLTEISEDLFSGITTNEGNFNGTFAGCTSLTEIPKNLFSGISGNFGGTFAGCTSLTEIPEDLFSEVPSSNTFYSTFYGTFYGCTSLTHLPNNLFSQDNIIEAGNEAFEYMFGECTNLSGYVPASLFANIAPSNVSGNIGPALYSMSGIFQGTNLDTQCPSNALINTTGFEAAWTVTDDNACVAKNAPSNCEFAVSCTPCTNDLVANATHTECIEPPTYELFLDTTNDTDSFSFTIAAPGSYYVDWGDGTSEIIPVTADEYKDVSHQYKSANSYTISLGGRATDYNEYHETVSFYQAPIARVRGSLGHIFPTIKNANNEIIAQPSFFYCFTECASLTQIDGNLFDGVTGPGVESMFQSTFAGTALESIPGGLFNGITGGAESMFYGTFEGCQQLQSIPENLFSDVTDVAVGMFAWTFASDAIDEETGEFLSSSITSLPNSLFPNITGTPAEGMFTAMFYGCSNLSGYVPATLFENLDYAENAMPSIFFDTGLSSTCPDNTTQYITGFESDWYTTMNAETNEFTSYAVSCVSNSPSGFTCNVPNVELSILGAPMCLISGLPQNNNPGLIVRQNGNQYHLLLSTTDSVIHTGSEHKIKIVAGDTTYYVHDESVAE